MEKRRFTKVEIIDAIVDDATKGQFTGDKRDGEAPPITRQNFHSEKFRYGARALRVRLSQMSYAELLRERDEAARLNAELWVYGEQEMALQKRRDREVEAQAFQKKQAASGRRRGLQSEIVEAARHYRDLKKSPKGAWREIKEQPYTAKNEATVVIQGDAENEKMFVRSRDGTMRRSGIRISQWQKVYWSAARRNSSKPG